ncbi:MAG: DUF4126 domain-containing protein [Reyranellaceae bacterium]
MDTLATLALALGSSWASGINMYLAALTIGIAGRIGAVKLPESLQALESPWILALAAVLYAVNFLADKIPAVDTVNNFIHTFLRVPAGAVLAGAAVGDADPAIVVAAALVGGTLAFGSHATKTGARVAATGVAPGSSIGLSVLEDIAVVGGLWLAIKNAVVFLILLAIVVALMIWLLPKMFRLFMSVVRRATGRRRLDSAGPTG